MKRLADWVTEEANRLYGPGVKCTGCFRHPSKCPDYRRGIEWEADYYLRYPTARKADELLAKAGFPTNLSKHTGPHAYYVFSTAETASDSET